MEPLSRDLLPVSAVVGADGRLSVGGIDVADLAKKIGTPAFVYDEAELRDRCREAVSAWGDGVAYAAKAFLCRAMASLAHEEGMCIDVSTGGEMHVALAGGVPPDRLVLHGNNKSEGELATALEAGVGRIVVDSFDEIDRLERLASVGTCPSVLARITPGVEAHTHEYVATGIDDSKFGFSLATGAAHSAVNRLSKSTVLRLVGIHAHIGSQIFRVDSFTHEVEVLAEFFTALGLPELNIGGGLGVAYVEGEKAPSIAEWAATVKEACDRLGIPRDVRVTAEPGRSIAARAGISLYQVGTIKEIPGIRTYVSVDGGMSDNPRPVLYGSGYEAFLPRAATADRPRPARIVGKHCESGDVIVREALLDDPKPGDVIVTPATGAYGYAMASNYNGVPRPPVIFCAEGDARVVVRRESFEDLTARDAP